MNYRYMARVMADERKRLDLMDFDLHALKYRGVMELARVGCDDDEIASYSGHTSKDMIRKYAGRPGRSCAPVKHGVSGNEQNRHRTET